ncbi:MAG: acetylglutamate kinase [Myxococcales bacterium]|nr:acetylglutamate kinase [Myxococcales bacterium]
MRVSFASRTTVVKLGGELLFDENADELLSILVSLRARARAGDHIVLVHGGGPQTSALMGRYGLEPQMIEGRRVTDEMTLRILMQAVGGEVNTRLVSKFICLGVGAVGLSGVSGRCVLCAKEPAQLLVSEPGKRVDYGFVGEVIRVDEDFILQFCRQGIVPVLACLGVDESGQVYNVNADTLAAAVSVALKSDHLLLITGAPGVLQNLDDPQTRWSKLRVSEAQKAIADGRIRGGMIPKIREAFSALSGGVGEVHILGQLRDGDIERALESPGEIGTVLIP